MIISIIAVSAKFTLGDNVEEPTTDDSSPQEQSDTTLPTTLVAIGPNQTKVGKFGEVVEFNLTVTNLQKDPDFIDIKFKSEPSGFSVNFFQMDGFTLLKDSPADGDGIPDTGLLMDFESIIIIAKITIPSDKFINVPEITTVFAKSSLDPLNPGAEAKLTTIANPFLDIKQSTAPNSVYVESSEIYGFNTKSRVTLDVTGGGLPTTVGNPVDVVLTLDNSGSMRGTPITNLVTAAINFVNKLNDGDRVAIFCFQGVFASSPRLLLNWTNMTVTGKINTSNAINSLLTDTDYYTPLWDTIHDALVKASAPRNDSRPIVIAMTDGANNRNNYNVVEPQPPWPPYDNDGNTNDDWSGPTVVKGLCEAPMTVFTIGLGISPGGSNENKLKEIALSSNPKGQYFYAPTSKDLDKIYDAIAKTIMNVSGEDPNPTDNKPMMTYVLPEYISFVSDSFRSEPGSIEKDPYPDYVQFYKTHTVLGWEVETIYINESWSVSFEVTSTKIGWVPVNLYPDSYVYYTNPYFPILTIPFPEIWLEVKPIPNPDLVVTNVMIDDTPYISSDYIITLEPSQEVEISGQVKNIGTSSTGIFVKYFYFTFFNSLIPYDSFFNTPVNALAPSAVSPMYQSTWKAPGIEGIFEIILYVDPGDRIPEGEAGEQNNIANITFRVKEPKMIDLVLMNTMIDNRPLTAGSVDMELKVEQEVEVITQALNLGNADTNFFSPNFHIASYNSTTPLAPFLDVVIDNLESYKITPQIIFKWTAPKIPGIFEIILFVDSTNVIPENDLEGEENNKIKIIFNVTETLVVDLVLTNLEICDILCATSIFSHTTLTYIPSIQIDLVSGQTIQISSQALNLGNSNTNRFYSKFDVSYYEFSISSSILTDPFLQESLEALTPFNLSEKYIANWTAPITPGIYKIVLFVDSDNDIPEGLNLEFETNNIIELEFQVFDLPAPPSPQLHISKNDVIIEWNTIQDATQYNIYGGSKPETIDFNLIVGKNTKNFFIHESVLVDFSEYYYIICTEESRGNEGPSSEIIGFKTITFQKGYSTFSLPLEPFTTHTADWYADRIFAGDSKDGVIFDYNATRQKWLGHPKGLPAGINDFEMLIGETYMLYTAEEIEYTFVGRPGTSIRYVDGVSGDPRLGTTSEFRENLILTTANYGIILNWHPANDIYEFESVDYYNIYRTNKRGAFNFDNPLATTPIGHPEITTYIDNIDLNKEIEYYYLVAPVNQFGRFGSSTYSIGIIIKHFTRGYNDFSLPLSPINVIYRDPGEDDSDSENDLEFKSKVIDFLELQLTENNMDSLYYYDHSIQKWIGIPELYPMKSNEIQLSKDKGYLIYVATEVTKFSFIGK